MGSGLFGIGVSGLQSFQTALNTTGHNIANVNTEYYSRQETLFEQRLPQNLGNGFIGTGVEVTDIRRRYDQFVVGQVQTSTSAFEQTNNYYNLASQVDNLLADPQVGLTPGLENFFNAVQEVSNDPTSIAARQVMLTESESLIDRFSYLYDRLDNLRSDSNNQIDSYVAEINSLAESIADLNDDIVIATGRSSGATPNDLLDQRDALIGKLSELVSVRTLDQDDGSTSVFIGNGQPLVLGKDASQLSSQATGIDPFNRDISIVNNGIPVPITEFITGGKLGGVLEFRDGMLNEAQNSIGRIAVGLATDFNLQHRAGMDLDGDINQAYFSEPAPEVLPATTNTGTLAVSISDTSQLTLDDYNMTYTGAAWEVRRVSDQQLVSFTGTGTVVDPIVFKGVSVEVTSAAAAGDEYLIRPTRVAARDVGTLLRDPRDIAAAGAVISEAGSTNTGSAQATLPDTVDVTNPALLNTVQITFTSPTTFDVFDVTAGVNLATGVTYDPADPADTVSYNGWSFDLSGAAATGDSFEVSSNAGGVGDNRNALALAGLQDAGTLAGGNATYSESYNQLVGSVGVQTRKAEITSASQEKLLSDAISTREAISGVNLDEEAANLLRYQQAYQASAQVIATANSLFDTLLNAVR
jgi:flagellar hook-associated protein 1 FlgK